MLVADVLAYVGLASAAGVLGNSSYQAVARLALWTKAHLPATTDALGDEEEASALSPELLSELRRLFAEAQAEWQPSQRADTANQTIVVGRDMNAAAVNQVIFRSGE